MSFMVLEIPQVLLYFLMGGLGFCFFSWGIFGIMLIIISKGKN